MEESRPVPLLQLVCLAMSPALVLPAPRWEHKTSIPMSVMYYYSYYYVLMGNLGTTILDFGGFGSSRILILRGGILMSMGNIRQSLSQQILVGRQTLIPVSVKSTPFVRAFALQSCGVNCSAAFDSVLPRPWRGSLPRSCHADRWIPMGRTSTSSWHEGRGIWGL